MSPRLIWLPILALAAAFAWPQDSAMRMAHPDHVLVEVPVDAPYPSATIELETDPVDGFNLHLATANFTFTPAAVNSDLVPNQGHAHLYLNGKKTARLYSPWRHLPSALFDQGVNRLEVVLNANDHSTWGLGGEPIGDEVLVYAQTTEGSPIVYGDVSYRATWEWGDAEALPQGQGWRVTNDLGYDVEVHKGNLVTRNLELVPCHAPPAMKPMARLFQLLSPTIAHAGHGSMLPNRSRISKSFEEDLARPTDHDVETRRVRDPEYCQAHFLIARPSGTAPSANSIEISGTWKKSGEEPIPFELQGAIAYGQLKDLLSANSPTASRQSIIGGVRVEVRRDMSSMFDGIDFASTDERAQVQAIARSIVTNARLYAE